MTRIFVKPSKGLEVINPLTQRKIDFNGEFVRNARCIRDMIRDRDIEIVDFGGVE